MVVYKQTAVDSCKYWKHSAIFKKVPSRKRPLVIWLHTMLNCVTQSYDNLRAIYNRMMKPLALWNIH